MTNTKRRQLTGCLLFFLTLWVTGCGTILPDGRRAARETALQYGMTPVRINAGRFILRGYNRLSGDDPGLTVYIEGDGRAWLDRTTPSSDPTPRRPVGLELASLDPSGNVVYLARPCQFVEGGDATGCHFSYWTSARYSPEVVHSLNVAVDRAKAMSGAAEVRLVGYSGGGVLALLLAAIRDDVAGVATVAGNLDHAAWTRHHGVSPLAGSLNPPEAADRLRDIPQIHFIGADDDVVPASVVQSYLNALGPAPVARLVLVPAMGHRDDWREAWPGLERSFYNWIEGHGR